MDFDQGPITTIHDYGYETSRTLRFLEDLKEERPINLVIPLAYGDLSHEALPGIVAELNKATFLNNVLVALYARSEEEFRAATHYFSSLERPHRVMWCNSPGIEAIIGDLGKEGIDLGLQGKGRDTWLALGAASVDAYAVVMHDADILNYSREIPMKLAFPLVDPDLDYFFNKGYYARLGDGRATFYGRVTRLFLHPLIDALQIKAGHQSEILRYLRSFRYPLAGEIALTSDLALNLRIPMDWGLEIGTLYEVYRSVVKKRICQTDLGFYDHKHKQIGAGRTEGLLKMAGDILVTLLRAMTEVDGYEISPAYLTSLRVLYRRTAQDRLRQYHADAICNQIRYNRHDEEHYIDRFEKIIVEAGNEYLTSPARAQIPDWLRASSAIPRLRHKLLRAVLEDEQIVRE